MARGILFENIVWTDYSLLEVDPNIIVQAPLKIDAPVDLNRLWAKLHALWKEESARNFIEMSNHWYFEANKNSGQAQILLIVAQNGLELICNWLLVEQKKILVGKDGDLSAVGKN